MEGGDLRAGLLILVGFHVDGMGSHGVWWGRRVDVRNSRGGGRRGGGGGGGGGVTSAEYIGT